MTKTYVHQNFIRYVRTVLIRKFSEKKLWSFAKIVKVLLAEFFPYTA